VDGTNAIEIRFDCSFLQKRVLEAPSEVRVLLNKGAIVLRTESGTHAVSGEVEKFMVMGASLEGTEVVLKPHRKERGQIRLTFDSYSVHDTSGAPLAQQTLLKAINRYLGSDES
jgi:hypothetical protein